MNLEDKKKDMNWYDNPGLISNIILFVLFLIIISSQSLGVKSELSMSDLISNILNLNTTYLIVLLYFVIIKFKYGKRYFSFFNMILLVLYFIVSVTSFLSIFQSFQIVTFLMLLINIVVFIQIFHTVLRDTRVWKEFHLDRSPFNEIKGNGYFYAIFTLCILYLLINLITISVDQFSGVVITLLVSVFYILFSRYFLLYSNHLDEKKVNSTNIGSFDEIKKNVDETVEKVKDSIDTEKIEEFGSKVEKTIDDAVDKISDTTREIVKDVKTDIETKKKKKAKKKAGDK